MYVSFSRWSGPYDYDKLLPTKASAAIDIGDALKDDTGLAGLTTGVQAVAIALQAKLVGDATQNSILTMLLNNGRTKLYGSAETGTLVKATDAGHRVDISSPDGLAADVTTKGDFFVNQVLSTLTGVGKLVILATQQAPS